MIPTKQHIAKKHKNALQQMAAELLPRDAQSVRILQARAAQLAKQPIKHEAVENLIRYVRIGLGEQRYGIPYEFVKEVMQVSGYTAVPRTVDYVAGIVNYRGILLPVLDLKKFFHLDVEQQDSDQASIIVIESGETVLGILTEQVNGSDECDRNKLDISLAVQTTVKSNYILGLHHGDTAIINVKALIDEVCSELSK